MKRTRSFRTAGIALAGILALTACGTDDTSDASGDGSAAAGGTGASGSLSGEGSSAQKNAILEVIADFQTANPDATVEYNDTGSGAGVTQFTAGQVDFAGSDSALKDSSDDGSTTEVDAAAERCGGNEAWNLPMVAGPIAIAYNLPGVDGLVLTPEVAAKIFNGTITTWNDAAIAAINPDVTLPSTAIKVYYRSDESGTTDNFQKYLNGAAPSVWTEDPSKTWSGTVGEGKAKSDGVATAVAGTEGAISYMEWSYATTNDLGVAAIDNGAGAVELSGESAGKAVEAAEQVGEGNDLKLSIDYATQEEGAYPIVLVTYEIVCSAGLEAEQTTLLKEFLTYFASTEEQDKLVDLGYAPLPEAVRTKVVDAIDAIS